MRIIDADRLMQHIKHKLCISSFDYLMASEKAIINVIESEPSVEMPTWIPCSERMPSDYNDYLVIDGDGEMAVGCYRDGLDAWDSSCLGWLERDNDDELPTRLGKVVAWMPLPEPWEGADDENHNDER